MTDREPTSLLSRARAWRDDDPDAETRDELAALLARRDDASLAALADRFAGRLEFGTAGLRGILGAGESRMNCRVVAQTTAGLCKALEHGVEAAKARGICIGYDGRRKSRQFAEMAAEIAMGQGFVVHLWSDVVPTPVLAYSVLDRKAAAGIMVTASHNPPEYNGYKVYWENGAQIIPPEDTRIAAQISAVASVLALPRGSLGATNASALLRSADEVEARYLRTVRERIGVEAEPAPLCIVYTALHGVGERLARIALAEAGFPHVHSVQAQARPDPAFPTVAFPNPEEPGAMDLALALAEQTRADLVLANDPDADRLSVAARDKAGNVVALTGNEAGLLLADHLLASAPHDGRNLVLASLVSTPLIVRLAKAHGARAELTLTGFKWIANRALELERREGLRTLLGFEEALGLSPLDLVRDKDGISSAVLVARIAAQHARAGHTLLDALEALYRRHGLYESRPVSITLRGHDGMQQMATVMDTLRRAPPSELAGHRVRSVLDLALGTEIVDGVSRSATLPSSNVIVLGLEGEHRICVRPSGTEPKLKFYVDAFALLAPEESLLQARERASALGQQLGSAILARAGLAR